MMGFNFGHSFANNVLLNQVIIWDYLYDDVYNKFWINKRFWTSCDSLNQKFKFCKMYISYNKVCLF